MERIRYWRPEDFEGIQKVAASCGWMIPTENPNRIRVAYGNSNIVVATVDSDVVGFIRYLTDSAISTYVIELGVLPEYRGSGIGRSLMQYVMRVNRCTSVDVLSNEMAGGFYKKMGGVTKTGYRLGGIYIEDSTN